ncbi:MAG: hypothetical protein WBQ40_18355, partial [Candidatus Sulfotelmatobacter sp.]
MPVRRLQLAYAHETHTPPIAAQNQQREAASKDRALFASNNHGRPTIAASARPGEFSGKGVIAARAAGGTYHAPKMTPKEARASGPSGNHAETAKGEAAKAAPRTEEKSAEKRTAERSSAEKSSAEKREEKAASHPAAEPRSNEKRSANSNA